MKSGILFTLLFITQFFFSQTTTNAESLISREWKLVFYEEDGEKFPPAQDQKESRMIFYPDHKVKSIEPGNIQNGIWKYNTTNKVLTITDNVTAEIASMKVLKLTDRELVLEYKDPDGIPLKMYMEPVKQH